MRSKTMSSLHSLLSTPCAFRNCTNTVRSPSTANSAQSSNAAYGSHEDQLPSSSFLIRISASPLPDAEDANDSLTTILSVYASPPSMRIPHVGTTNSSHATSFAPTCPHSGLLVSAQGELACRPHGSSCDASPQNSGSNARLPS